jgi:hypothetical protein
MSRSHGLAGAAGRMIRLRGGKRRASTAIEAKKNGSMK